MNRCQSEPQQSCSANKSRKGSSTSAGAIAVSSKECCERGSSWRQRKGLPMRRFTRELSVHVDTVRLWRDRGVGRQGIDLKTLSLLERLQDAPRPGGKGTFGARQRCPMAALVCEAPAQAGRPISQWTGRSIADERKARGIVEQRSPRHAVRRLTKRASNRTASAPGSSRCPTSTETNRWSRAVKCLPRQSSGPGTANVASAGTNGLACKPLSANIPTCRCRPVMCCGGNARTSDMAHCPGSSLSLSSPGT